MPSKSRMTASHPIFQHVSIAKDSCIFYFIRAFRKDQRQIDDEIKKAKLFNSPVKNLE